VLVDVDGTLLDTNYLHTLAWARAFRDLGEWAPMNAIHRLMGMGGDHLVPELFGREIPGADAAHTRRFAELEPEARPFPGAAILLRRLHEANLVVVLATSSPERDVAGMRKRLDADDAIDAVVDGDEVTSSKPSPEIFETACAKANVDPTAAVVIGDSVWDVWAARAAGLKCLVVESGGFGRLELLEAGALAVYRDAQDLCGQLLTSAIAPLITRRGRRSPSTSAPRRDRRRGRASSPRPR
jgi:HAD superfamily hydrolase (TIGR01509 family)